MNSKLFPFSSILLLTCFLLTPLSAQPTKPPALKKGDTIALVAPASPVSEERVKTVTEGLEAMGYEVWQAPNLTERYGYLAGTDEERAGAIMAAYENPDVTAIFSLTGGYGTPRIIGMLDYHVIKANPKILTGFSDITGLHLAIHAMTDQIVFHTSTTPYAVTNNAEKRPVQATTMWRAIAAESYEGADGPGYTLPGMEVSSPTLVLNPGKAKGRLTGGNLSLIMATMGSPYQMETEGRIVFIEDVGEEPYRLDRMFATLENAGLLENPAAVILGQFAGCEPDNPEKSLTMDQVYARYFGGRDYPVVKDFPVGHVIDNVAIPIGAMAEFDAEAGTITILEDPVVLD